MFSQSEITLYDLSGKLLWRKKITTRQSIMEVDLPALSRGIYLIKAGDTVKKLVIR